MTEKQKYIKQLYEKYCNSLKIVALIYGANQADLDDLVQDTFELAMKKVDALMKCNDPRVWLVKTLENLIRNHRRLYVNKFTRSLEECGDFPAPEGAEPLSHILPAKLSDGEKKILIWRFEEEIGYKEMSRRLGISEEYCRVKVCRIIRKCQELMKNEKN